MRKRSGVRFCAVLLGPLLFLAGRCAQNRAAVREDGPQVEAHVPPAEAIGVSLQTKSPEGPRGLLPYAQGDEGSGRNPASRVTGWIVIIEFTFSRSPVQPEPTASVESTTASPPPDGAAD